MQAFFSIRGAALVSGALLLTSMAFTETPKTAAPKGAPLDSAWKANQDARFQARLDGIIRARYQHAADLRTAAAEQKARADSIAEDSPGAPVGTADSLRAASLP